MMTTATIKVTITVIMGNNNGWSNYLIVISLFPVRTMLFWPRLVTLLSKSIEIIDSNRFSYSSRLFYCAKHKANFFLMRYFTRRLDEVY